MRNAARVATVWLDEYIKYFYLTVAGAQYINTGDTSDRKGKQESWRKYLLNYCEVLLIRFTLK